VSLQVRIKIFRTYPSTEWRSVALGPCCWCRNHSLLPSRLAGDWLCQPWNK